MPVQTENYVHIVSRHAAYRLTSCCLKKPTELPDDDIITDNPTSVTCPSYQKAGK